MDAVVLQGGGKKSQFLRNMDKMGSPGEGRGGIGTDTTYIISGLTSFRPQSASFDMGRWTSAFHAASV